MSDITDRLKELAHAAADQNWGEFSMRVPADHARDADLVLLAASKEITSLRAELTEARKPDCRLCEHFDDWDMDCVLRGTAAACVGGHNYLGVTPVRLYENAAPSEERKL